MKALSAILQTVDDDDLSFHCPGCGGVHTVMVGEGDGPRWGYNGDPVRPTFTPSLLVRGNKLTLDESGRWNGGWERDAEGKLIPTTCHSFVTDGQIQFLGDCTHALAGQTLPIPNFEE